MATISRAVITPLRIAYATRSLETGTAFLPPTTSESMDKATPLPTAERNQSPIFKQTKTDLTPITITNLIKGNGLLQGSKQSLMNQFLRKLQGGYEASFDMLQRSLIINVTHSLKSVIFFSRISDHHLPENLKEIVDNATDLYEVIRDLQEGCIQIGARDSLVLLMGVGKKVKEYALPLEKADISAEESLKKKVSELQKQLELKEFEAKFYKEQYRYLLEHLQLTPDRAELEKLYRRGLGDVLEDRGKLMKAQSMFESKAQMNSSLLSSKSEKVGSAQKIDLRCVKSHPLQKQDNCSTIHSCNVCRKRIQLSHARYVCKPCDFDMCTACSLIPGQNRKYCPKQHGITFGVATNYFARRCDLCRSSLAFTKGFTCLECDFDVCKDCAK